MKQSVGRTKDLNEVTKKSHSLHFMLLESSERHCKPCGLQQGLCLPCHQCCCFERLGSMWETRRRLPPQDETVLPDCQDQQVLISHPILPTLPKVELCFGARSLYCNHLSSSLGDRPSVAANLQQSHCLTTSTVKAASLGKHTQRSDI